MEFLHNVKGEVGEEASEGKFGSSLLHMGLFKPPILLGESLVPLLLSKASVRQCAAQMRI